MLGLDNLKEEMPKMPEQIKQMMEQEVAKQLSSEHERQAAPRRKRKMTWRQVAAIALVASLAVGGTAYAGVKLYQLKMEKEGNYGLKAGVSKTESSDGCEKYEIPEEIPVLSIEPQYLDGMIQSEDGVTKYYHEDTPYQGGISINVLTMDEGVSADNLPLIDTNVIFSEAITINGRDGIYLEKDVMAGNKTIYFNKKIYVTYPEYWQVLEIFVGEDVTKEEAMKVVENLKVTPTEKMQSPMDIGMWSSGFEQVGTSLEGIGDKQTATADEMRNLHQIGDTFPIRTVAATDTTDWLDTESIHATVTDVQIMDNISALDPAYSNDSRIRDQVDADGNLIPNKIHYLKSGDGINYLDNIVRTEEVPQKLVYVTIELKNTSDIELKDVLINGGFNRAIEKDGVYSYYNRLRENGDSQANGIHFEGNSGLGEMVYYDFRGGTRGNNHIASMMPQESKTIYIAGIVNEDELDKMYFYIGAGGGTTSFTEEALKMGYVDIRQK